MTADTDQPTLAVQAHEWRKREVQAIGAAISTRSWHAVEQAYNSLRDKMDRAGCWWAPDTRITHEPRPAGELREAAQALKAMHEDEIAVLRKTLIKMGRMLPGVALHDEVSSSFLTNLPAELAAALATHSPAPMAGEGKNLVWSNEHKAWWGADHRGYTRFIEQAGRYDRAEALKIAGTRDGGWRLNKGNPDEIAIPEQDAIDQYADISREQAAALTEGQQS